MGTLHVPMVSFTASQAPMDDLLSDEERITYQKAFRGNKIGKNLAPIQIDLPFLDINTTWPSTPYSTDQESSLGSLDQCTYTGPFPFDENLEEKSQTKGTFRQKRACHRLSYTGPFPLKEESEKIHQKKGGIWLKKSPSSAFSYTESFNTREEKEKSKSKKRGKESASQRLSLLFEGKSPKMQAVATTPQSERPHKKQRILFIEKIEKKSNANKKRKKRAAGQSAPLLFEKKSPRKQADATTPQSATSKESASDSISLLFEKETLKMQADATTPKSTTSKENQGIILDQTMEREGAKRKNESELSPLNASIHENILPLIPFEKDSRREFSLNESTSAVTRISHHVSYSDSLMQKYHSFPGFVYANKRLEHEAKNASAPFRVKNGALFSPCTIPPKKAPNRIHPFPFKELLSPINQEGKNELKTKSTLKRKATSQGKRREKNKRPLSVLPEIPSTPKKRATQAKKLASPAATPKKRSNPSLLEAQRQKIKKERDSPPMNQSKKEIKHSLKKEGNFLLNAAKKQENKETKQVASKKEGANKYPIIFYKSKSNARWAIPLFSITLLAYFYPFGKKSKKTKKKEYFYREDVYSDPLY